MKTCAFGGKDLEIFTLWKFVCCCCSQNYFCKRVNSEDESAPHKMEWNGGIQYNKQFSIKWIHFNFDVAFKLQVFITFWLIRKLNTKQNKFLQCCVLQHCVVFQFAPGWHFSEFQEGRKLFFVSFFTFWGWTLLVGVDQRKSHHFTSWIWTWIVCPHFLWSLLICGG